MSCVRVWVSKAHPSHPLSSRTALLCEILQRLRGWDPTGRGEQKRIMNLIPTQNDSQTWFNTLQWRILKMPLNTRVTRLFDLWESTIIHLPQNQRIWNTVIALSQTRRVPGKKTIYIVTEDYKNPCCSDFCQPCYISFLKRHSRAWWIWWGQSFIWSLWH